MLQTDDSGYRFEGKVIKLTLKDFNKWKELFSALDLEKELRGLDAYLAPKRLHGWFYTVYSMLQVKQENYEQAIK